MHNHRLASVHPSHSEALVTGAHAENRGCYNESGVELKLQSL